MPLVTWIPIEHEQRMCLHAGVWVQMKGFLRITGLEWSASMCVDITSMSHIIQKAICMSVTEFGVKTANKACKSFHQQSIAYYGSFSIVVMWAFNRNSNLLPIVILGLRIWEILHLCLLSNAICVTKSKDAIIDAFISFKWQVRALNRWSDAM